MTTYRIVVVVLAAVGFTCVATALFVRWLFSTEVDA